MPLRKWTRKTGDLNSATIGCGHCADRRRRQVSWRAVRGRESRFRSTRRFQVPACARSHFDCPVGRRTRVRMGVRTCLRDLQLVAVRFSFNSWSLQGVSAERSLFSGVPRGPLIPRSQVGPLESRCPSRNGVVERCETCETCDMCGGVLSPVLSWHVG